MTSWQEEQALFWQWVTNNDLTSSNTEKMHELLEPHNQLSQAEAVSIYNNAYHYRLIDISKKLYPMLFNTLGDEHYKQLWLNYLSEYPPQPGPINYIGNRLADYLSNHPKFQLLPALVDIVSLEWKLIELFDKIDQVPFTLQQLKNLPAKDWGSSVWSAKQDWTLLESEFDLKNYWQQMEQHTIDGVEAGSGDVAVQRVTTKNTYLIFRHKYQLQFQPIELPLKVFLNAIINELRFSQICELLSEQFPEEDIPQLSLRLLMESVEKELLVLQPK